MHRLSRALVRLTATLTGLALLPAALTLAAPAQADNPATPGNFTGYGFDQCLAPTQRAMDTWLTHSPFLAVGIYISGNSRACRNQPNLTPAWIRTQLEKGWRLLPITLGPQASCQPRFPRYDDDPTISPRPGRGGQYRKARRMGRAEATKTVGDARALGLVAGSTLWYDLEGFDVTNTRCRESALAFLHAWTVRLHALDYVSGVYSSASSGIKMLDDARVHRPGKFTLPDRIWIARWDGVANTSTSYIGEKGWRPGGRMKQYRGGHNETWGGVTINIDSNYLDLGKGSVATREVHCRRVNLDFAAYGRLGSGAGSRELKRALQCLLKEKGFYRGRTHGRWSRRTVRAARAWQASRDLPVRDRWMRRHWSALLSEGDQPVLKTGSAGAAVFRLQRALNAADNERVPVTGVFDKDTTAAVRAFQSRTRIEVTGVAAGPTWNKLG